MTPTHREYGQPAARGYQWAEAICGSVRNAWRDIYVHKRARRGGDL